MKQKIESLEIMHISQMMAANRESVWNLEMIYKRLEDDLDNQKWKERRGRNRSEKP